MKSFGSGLSEEIRRWPGEEEIDQPTVRGGLCTRIGTSTDRRPKQRNGPWEQRRPACLVAQEGALGGKSGCLLSLAARRIWPGLRIHPQTLRMLTPLKKIKEHKENLKKSFLVVYFYVY